MDYYYDEGYYEPDLVLECSDIIELGCDCEAVQAAFIEFLSTGYLNIDAACGYIDTAEMEQETIDIYNDCIANYDIDSFPYAECNYCNVADYMLEGAEEIT